MPPYQLELKKTWKLLFASTCNTLKAKNNNIHTIVSVFGADRYMHVMTAMTVNDQTFDKDTWWKKISILGTE